MLAMMTGVIAVHCWVTAGRAVIFPVRGVKSSGEGCGERGSATLSGCACGVGEPVPNLA
jgi:hypothetical protein